MSLLPKGTVVGADLWCLCRAVHQPIEHHLPAPLISVCHTVLVFEDAVFAILALAILEQTARLILLLSCLALASFATFTSTTFRNSTP